MAACLRGVGCAYVGGDCGGYRPDDEAGAGVRSSNGNVLEWCAPTMTSAAIRCKHAALDGTHSQSGSGAVGCDMVQPEVTALRAGVGGAVAADACDPVEQRLFPEGGSTEIGPVLPPAAGDGVVDGREGESP